MSQTNIIYQVDDRPSWGKTIVFALQQLLAILAATIAVPGIIGHGMSHAAALVGAGVGTLIYLVLTKFKSPVFLGSSFAFIGPMFGAFGGAATAGLTENVGYIGLVLGALLAGLVYVIIALVVKFVGTNWIKTVMPAVVIGPTVAIIGLSLAPNAINDLLSISTASDTVGSVTTTVATIAPNTWTMLLCGLVTLGTTVAFSVYGKGFLRMIPFVMGIVAGYLVGAACTGIGALVDNEGVKNALTVIDFSAFEHMKWLPDFTFVSAFNGFKDFNNAGEFFSYFGTIAGLYIPVAFVVFAEHLADHKNLSSVIGKDLLEDPGLHRTLLGDGIGSAVGAFFGGCPNTTYGESVGTVAISGNASIVTIFVTAIMCIVLAFIAPFSTFLASIPRGVMGGVCIALYGFISVSGLKMLQPVDLNDSANLFTASAIFITGVGGLILKIGNADFSIELRTVACALILGILVNFFANLKKGNAK